MHQQPPSPEETHDESYFASFTDMLVGILFVFIILLMISANSYQEAADLITKKEAAELIAKKEAAELAARKAAAELAAQRKAERASSRQKAAVEPVAEKGIPGLTAGSGQLSGKDRARDLRRDVQRSLNESRDKVLMEIEHSLKQQGIPASLDLRRGLLRLPEDILFAADGYEVTPSGQHALNSLAAALVRYLPCISPTSDLSRLASCSHLNLDIKDGLMTVFIEDSTSATGSPEHKWLLSAQRAVSVFGEIKRHQPYLNKDLKNISNVPILNVRSYKALREQAQRRKHADLSKSIEFRFIMRRPLPTDIQDHR